MSVLALPFYDEVEPILNNSAVDGAIFYYAQIQAGDQTVLPIGVTGLDQYRRYGRDYADDIRITLSIGYGTYLKRVVPNQNNLKVTVIKRRLPLAREGIEGESITETFTATLMGVSDDNLASHHTLVDDEEAANRASIITIKLQLQDQALAPLRLETVGGNFRQENPGRVCRGLLTRHSQGLDLEQNYQVRGVQMQTPHNSEVFDHVIIPHGTPLIEMPDLLQRELGGIYSAGLGIYLWRHYWYVWSLYDLTRFDTAKRTLTLFIIPSNLLYGVERTYRTTTRQVLALVTGGAQHRDDTERQLSNQGNAVRYADSRKIMQGFASASGNKATASRLQNTTEYAGQERPSGLLNAPLSGQRATRNAYHQASQLAERKGSYLMVNWQHSNAELLEPDMPIKVFYLQDGQPRYAYATLIEADTFITGTQPGVTNVRHQSHTALKLFIGPPVDDAI